MICIDDILSFLYFGYLTKNSASEKQMFTGIDFSGLNRLPEDIVYDEDAIIKEGAEVLKNIFSYAEGGKYIVPLSGGIDSRTVLAGLISAGYKDKITTVTFGSPGSWDYELGIALAQKLKLPFKVFDLSKIIIDENTLIKTAENGSSWTFLIDAYFNSLICSEFGKDAVYWSGFMGDALAGEHLPASESETWPEAVDFFVRRNRFVSAVDLTPKEFKPHDQLPAKPLAEGGRITYDDQLDLFFRQQNYIKRVITFEGYNYKTPFLNKEWIRFIITLPFKYRGNSYIYKKIVNYAFGEFFKFPTANNYGGSLNISPTELFIRKKLYGLKSHLNRNENFRGTLANPFWKFLHIYNRINYMDFDAALRIREDYRLLVRKSINDLRERKIIDFINADLMFHEHMGNKMNYGYALMLLTALEINLKVSETLIEYNDEFIPKKNSVLVNGNNTSS